MRVTTSIARYRAGVLSLALAIACAVMLISAGAAWAAPTGEEDAQPLTTPELIDQAHASGQITAEQRLLYLAYAIYAPDRLPAELESNKPWFGTDVVAELQATAAAIEANQGELSAAGTNEFLGLLRSDAATVCDQEDGANSLNSANFHLNYNSIGGGLSPQIYADSLEQAYGVEIISYSWAEPPLCQAGVGACSSTNPWNRYPVQVADLGGSLYGYVTSPGGDYAGFMGDNPNTETTETAAFASCMVLNDDYSGFPGGSQFALDVTTAHEFSHSIQFGYGDPSPQEAGMWYESMAAYIEDDVLDDADDNYQYLWPAFDVCLEEHAAYPDVYGYWPIFRYAAEQNGGTNVAGGGEDIFQAFWANVGQGEPGLVAFNNALATKGANLNDTFHDFAITTAFLQSCPNGSPYCYEESAGYEAAAGMPDVHGAIASIGGSQAGSVPDHYAINWIELPTSGTYAIALTAAGPLRVSIVAESGNSLNVTQLTSAAGQNSATLPAYTPPNGATRVLAVITNQRMTSENPSSCSSTSYTLATEAPSALAVQTDGPTGVALDPGESKVYAFTVQNVGAEDAEFALSATSSQGWANTDNVPATVNLAAGATRTVNIRVTIPLSATAGTVEATKLTATSTEDESVTSSHTVQTRVGQAEGAFLPIIIRGREQTTPDCTPDPAGETSNINDSRRICSGQTVTGSVSQSDRSDVYKIYFAEDTGVSITLSGSGGDADLYLYTPDATDVNETSAVAISINLDSNELIEGTALVSGDWYIEVYSYEGSTDYQLQVNLATARIPGFGTTPAGATGKQWLPAADNGNTNPAKADDLHFRHGEE
ncbi:MAG: pre-peptidase C-terminal domain-containing protein [Caldilineaceae bacterium]|nr:pre-peptidase C-terminal domain-containing protein [Caldilineaceae bacterium]